MKIPLPLLWCMFSNSKMQLPPLLTATPLLENVFIGTLAISSPLKCNQLPVTTNPWVYPEVEIVMFVKSNTGISPGYAQYLMRLVSDVPLFENWMPAPVLVGVVIRYVPARMKTVSPATATLAPFCNVAKGAAMVPAFESLPVVAT